MKNRVKVILLLLLLTITSLFFYGCSNVLEPSDAEVIAALESQEEHNVQFCDAFFSGYKILQKGSKSKDGTWPFRVEAQCGLKSVGRCYTLEFIAFFSQTQDSMNKNNIWVYKKGPYIKRNHGCKDYPG